MNIALFAVIGIVILVIAVLVLKRITSGKKSPAEDVIVKAQAETDEVAVKQPVEPVAEVEEPEEQPEVEAEVAAEEEKEEKLEPEAQESPATPSASNDDVIVEETAEAIEVDLIAEEIAPEVKEEEEPFAEPEDTVELPPLTEPITISFSLDQYGDRLKEREEAQRLAVAEAMRKGEDDRRDTLQLELVAINEKLALLEEAYEQERTCYQEVLDLLPQLEGELDHADLDAAAGELSEGSPMQAEELLASLMEQADNNQVAAAFYSGRLAECRFDLETALDRYTWAITKEPGNTAYLHTAGLTAKRMYRYPQAIEWLGSFISLQDADPGADPIKLAQVKRDLAHTYVVAGQSQKAGALYKQAMTAFTDALGREHPEMATCWFQIGELQETMGEYDKAVSLYKQSLAILDKTKGKGHPALAPVLAKLAALCMELEMEKEAVPLYERLVSIREATLPSTHPQLAMSLNSLAESYRLQGMHDEAEGCYLKCLNIAEKTQGKDSPGVGAILQELAKLCQSLRKKEEAEQYQARATAIFEKVVKEQEKQSQDDSLSLEL